MKWKKWSRSDTKRLMDHYEKCTIKELEEMFPGRSRESINNKIKRLKRAGKIAGGKTEETIQRAYDQRGEDEE